MKRAIQTYTYAPGGAGAGTVTLTNFTTIQLDRILTIFNVTRGVLIFNLADSTKGGTVATNVLTLATSTSGHNSGDSLYIVYDDLDLDFDSGAGVVPRQAMGLIVPTSGGPAIVPGDGTNGLKVQALDAAIVTLGAKADAKSTATDTTAISVMQVLKQISAQLQAGSPLVLNKHVSASGTLVANTTATPTLTWSTGTAVELEVTSRDGAAIIYGTLDGTTPSATNFGLVLPATPSSVIIPCNATPTLKLISAGTPLYAAAVRGY